jgi:hypothetical protein
MIRRELFWGGAVADFMRRQNSRDFDLDHKLIPVLGLSTVLAEKTQPCWQHVGHRRPFDVGNLHDQER